MIGIYKITNLQNGKCYIGQSVDIEARWKDEIQRAFIETDNSYNYPLSRALRNYGIENFSFEVIEECSQLNLNEREKYWIEYFNSFCSGYNQTLGGDSGHLIKCTKEILQGIILDLKTTELKHHQIAEKWKISTEMVQGINTGRYWFDEQETYPLQTRFKEKRVYLCKNCGTEISKGAELCAKCYNLSNRKAIRPSRDDLKQMIRNLPFTQIAKQYGVTDNAIRKWCKNENLPTRRCDIEKYNSDEWKLL